MLILFFSVLALFNFNNFKVFFDSERIIELSSTDKDIVQKSIANIEIVAVQKSESRGVKSDHILLISKKRANMCESLQKVRSTSIQSHCHLLLSRLLHPSSTLFLVHFRSFGFFPSHVALCSLS